MKRYYQIEPFSIADFKVIDWKHPIHKHNHYELIYIKSGKGVHIINGVENNYKRGSIYLLGPNDDHYFQVVALTHFVYLKFTDQYLHRDKSAGNMYLRKLEYLLKSRETHFDGYELAHDDQIIADQIFNVMVSMKDKIAANEDLLWLQLLSLAAILQRNMPEIKTTENRSRDMQALFCYLHKYIYEPGKLKAAEIARAFNTTAGYIGPYFKRNTGLTLRNYIHDYRKVLIGRRIDSGKFSLKEIAADFGLTDESHVKKVMKQI